jgi:hypothetical protein
MVSLPDVDFPEDECRGLQGDGKQKLRASRLDGWHARGIVDNIPIFGYTTKRSSIRP